MPHNYIEGLSSVKGNLPSPTLKHRLQGQKIDLSNPPYDHFKKSIFPFTRQGQLEFNLARLTYTDTLNTQTKTVSQNKLSTHVKLGKCLIITSRAWTDSNGMRRPRPSKTSSRAYRDTWASHLICTLNTRSFPSPGNVTSSSI